jgi:hypothetical protein
MTQIEMKLPTWGGKRPRAGRKPKGRRAGVAHRSREVSRHQPLHVTLRVRPSVWDLRGKRMFAVIRRAMVAGCDRFGFRLVHHSVQDNHIHLVCEADDAIALGRGLKGLGVRLARRLNALMKSRGAVLADRYHARSLRTPNEVRAVLNYVLRNYDHHAEQRGRKPESFRFDTRSSAAWFDGWARPPPTRPDEPRPGAEARTWLLRLGWRRLGLLRA